MKVALLELVRRPGRFVAAGGILTLIAILLMFIGGLLDGLLGSSTGAFRAQRGELMAFSASSNRSLPRSLIPITTEDAVAGVTGVKQVGGLGITQAAARPGSDPNTRSLIPIVVIGYETPPNGLENTKVEPGTVYADSAIRSRGIEIGDTLLLGAPRTPVKVAGFVDDSRLSGQISLWTPLRSWNEIAASIRPGTGDSDLVQALVIDTDEPDDVMIDRIERSSNGSLEVLSLTDAIDSLPGVATQRTTVNQVIGVTVVVALVVIALFFALITIERTTLYGVLKAIGASNRTLFGGVVLQAITLAVAASLIAALLSIALAVLVPPGTLPYSLSAQRIGLSSLLLLVAAIGGCAFSLRRVLGVDPATAIGD